jgi:hypothetical protein
MNIFERIFGYFKDSYKEAKTNLDADSLDENTYRGVKYELCDGKGNVLFRQDTRDLKFEQLAKLRIINDKASEDILENAPLYKQLNSLAGRLTDNEESELNTHINNIRTAVRANKLKVMQAATLDELDKIE